MEIAEVERAVEAVLFATGEPVKLSRLSEIIEVEEETLKEVLR